MIPEPVVHGLFERVGVASDSGLVVSKYGIVRVDVDNPVFTDNLIAGSSFCNVSGQFSYPAAGAVVNLDHHIQHLIIDNPDTNIHIEKRRLLAEEGTNKEEKRNHKPFHGANLLTCVHHVNLS